MVKVATSKPERKIRQPEILTNAAGKTLASRFDVTDLLRRELGADWQTSFRDFMTFKSEHMLRSNEHKSVRESAGTEVEMLFVNGHSIFRYFSGLEKLYRGPFKKLMMQSLLDGAEALTITDEPIMAVEAYEQTEKEGRSQIERRMEAHTDSRYTAVLIIDTPAKGYGGRLVIGNDPRAATPAEIKRDATYMSKSQGRCFVSRAAASYPILLRKQ